MNWLTGKPKAEPPSSPKYSPDPNARWGGRYRLIEYTRRNGSTYYKAEVWVAKSSEWSTIIEPGYTFMHWTCEGPLIRAEKQLDTWYGNEVIAVKPLDVLPVIEIKAVSGESA